MLGNILNMGQEFTAKIVKVFPPVYPEMPPRVDMTERPVKESVI
jgi:hypothetical protein